MNRRTLIAALTSVAAFSLAAAAAAQTPDDYPNRPIRIIVPQAAGSGVDQQARVLAQKMGELWGQQGVVENRPGANAILGMETVAKAHPAMSLGSYPFFNEGVFGSNLVLRGRDPDEVAATVDELIAVLAGVGVQNVREIDAS